MPRKAKELSAIQVKRLSKPGLHAVGGVAGLYLQVTDTGARSWVLRALVGGKRRSIGLGGYPDVPLADAREKARRARDQIAEGIDPVQARRDARAALAVARARDVPTFAKAAKERHKAKAVEFRNDKHAAQWMSSLARHAFPVIGDLPVDAIDRSHILTLLQPIWQEKTETASRVRQRIEKVLDWATVAGYRSGENPARWSGNLKEQLPAPAKLKKVKHHAALPFDQVPGFMGELRQREGTAARALEFLILTAARSGEVRFAKWDEIDLEAKVWTIPGERIKAGKRHTVPLSQDAIALLKSVPTRTDSSFIFPAPRGGALSDMSLSAVLKRMNVEAVPHGFRSSFKDWARSKTRYADEVSELALAHVNDDKTRAAYARDELLPQRFRMMRDWASYLRATEGGKVTPLRSAS